MSELILKEQSTPGDARVEFRSFDSIAYVMGAIALAPAITWPALLGVPWCVLVFLAVFGLHRRLSIANGQLVSNDWYLFSLRLLHRPANALIDRVRVRRTQSGAARYEVLLHHHPPDKPGSGDIIILRSYDIFCFPARKRAVRRADQIAEILGVPRWP